MANPNRVSLPNFDLGTFYKTVQNSCPVEDQHLCILVLGPSLGENAPGSRLRSHIVQECRRLEIDVVLAEHSELQEFFVSLYDPIDDLCKMEWTLATEKDKNTGHDLIDAILILPDSPGSFVELGMFVFGDHIHSKILVLFNKEHEATMQESFIGRGAKLAFDNGHASTIIMDYGDLRNSWTAVRRFLDFRRSSRRWDRLKRRTRHDVRP